MLYHLYSFVREGTAIVSITNGFKRTWVIMVMYSGMRNYGCIPPLLVMHPEMAKAWWNIAINDWMQPNEMHFAKDIKAPCFPGKVQIPALKKHRCGH